MPDSFIPPTSVRNAAKRGLALRQKYGRGGLTTQQAGMQGIGSGVQRASDLANGKGITLDTVRRMVNFFNRHEKNRSTPPEKGNGMISWLLWGGDAGRAWAESVLKNQESTKARADAPNYRPAGPNLERCSTCQFFKARQCTKYKFTAQASYTCDAWRPNVEKSQALRDLWGKESEEQKEVSAVATAIPAHGPGGLLSPLGLGKQKRKKRGAKTVKIDKPTKTIAGVQYPATAFLVVGDEAEPSTWHLPVKGPDGTPDRARMGAAFAALTSNYRGQSYQGEGKAQALVKLRKLYQELGEKLPGAESQKETFDKASTQLDMPAVIKAKALLFSRSIDKTDLHENGIERDTHVTVKYGVNDNTLDKVKQIAAEFGPITLKFGKVSLFERPDEGFDVVKIEVESPELRALNRAISTLPNADTRKGYNPHLTIAYVKSGTGKKYVGDGPLNGKTVTIDTLQFSDKDGVKTPIKLAGEPKVTNEKGEISTLDEIAKKYAKWIAAAVGQSTLKHVSHNQQSHGSRHGVGGLREFAKKRGYQVRDAGPDAGKNRFQIKRPGTNDSIRAGGITDAKKLIASTNKRNIEAARKLQRERKRIADEQKKRETPDKPKGLTRQQNAFRKANEIQLEINRLSNEHSRNNPAKGYYNASENKRRQRVQADLQNRMAELQKQQQAYQKIANPGMFKEGKQSSTFTVYKDSKGQYRWLAISSNAYRDKDGEIVSLKALQDDITRSDKEGDYGPLRFWHMPGVDIGDCDFNMLHGKMLLESGTFRTKAIARKVANKASDYQMSIGFRHPDDEPDRSGVFHNIRRFERSLVPAGRAANPFTAFSVSEQGETVKHGSHNQASHGFRFGKAPSLTQARRYRKAGVLDEYSKRSRDRSGTKPAKARNAAKPKPVPKPTPKPAAAKPKRSIPDTKRFVKDRITALGGKKVSFKPMKDGRLQIVAQSERGTSPKGINAYINANGEIVRRDGTRAIGW